MTEKRTVPLETDLGDVEIDEFGCHLWLGQVNAKGYGPHKASLESYLGRKLPAGVFADHFCRRRRCINPLHLDPVTQGENEMRKSAHYRRGLEQCPIGHRLIDPLATPEKGLICRACLKS